MPKKLSSPLKWLVEATAATAGECQRLREVVGQVDEELALARARVDRLERERLALAEQHDALTVRLEHLHRCIRVAAPTADPADIVSVRQQRSIPAAVLEALRAGPLERDELARSVARTTGRRIPEGSVAAWFKNFVNARVCELIDQGRIRKRPGRRPRRGSVYELVTGQSGPGLADLRANALRAGVEIAPENNE